MYYLAFLAIVLGSGLFFILLLFDFTGVEIIQATDEDVERFAIKLGNDMDELRRPRYGEMRCQVSSLCPLSDNTMRILHRTFGQVEIKQPTGPG